MVIAVTGSKGFIGSHLVKRLAVLGFQIIEIDSINGYDVTRFPDLESVGRFDCIVHLAGKTSITESFKHPYNYLSQNYLSILNVLELSKRYNAKVIFASSNIYGQPQYLPINETHPHQITNPYTQSKIIGEELCQLYSQNFGIPCISLRKFNIYGQGMNSGSLIPTIFKQLHQKEIKVWDSRPERDYIHIDDIIEAYIASINYRCNGFEAFNIASGKSYSVLDIVNHCESHLCKNFELIDLNEPRQNDILKIEADISKAQDLLGWFPKVDFKKGLSELIDLYYKSDSPKTVSAGFSGEVKSDYIPLSVPSIKGNEWSYVKDCLDTEWVSSVGKYVDEFELKIAQYTQAKYAVACVNGTAALHVSLIISGVLPGDEVIVPSITFIAPINAVRYCQAHPVFMDADKFYNLDVDKTIDFILNETELKSFDVDDKKSWYTVNKKTGRRISAIIPVHVFGNAVWLDDLVSICEERNIKIIEDATESLGTNFNRGKFSGRYTGTIGEFGCLSFNGNKIITTGGGGMILTNKKELAERAKYLTTQAKDDHARFVHNAVGYNYRLTNILAALGLAQLERLNDFIKIKKENYSFYKYHIDKISGLYLADLPHYSDNNHWMYALQIDKEIYGKDREQLMDFLESNKIQTRPVWYLNHLQKEYLKCQTYKIENAEKLLSNTLNIPCSVNLEAHQMDKVIGKLNER